MVAAVEMVEMLVGVKMVEMVVEEEMVGWWRKMSKMKMRVDSGVVIYGAVSMMGEEEEEEEEDDDE